MKQLFQVTERLITDQTEISGLTTIDYEQPVWKGRTPQRDKAGEITNAKTYFSSRYYVWEVSVIFMSMYNDIV